MPGSNHHIAIGMGRLQYGWNTHFQSKALNQTNISLVGVLKIKISFSVPTVTKIAVWHFDGLGHWSDCIHHLLLRVILSVIGHDYSNIRPTLLIITVLNSYSITSNSDKKVKQLSWNGVHITSPLMH
jgi:hypothetical protein